MADDPETVSGSTDPVSMPVFKKRNRGGNLRKKPAAVEEDGGADEGDGGVNLKKPKQRRDGLAFKTTKDKDAVAFAYEASGLLQQHGDQGATKGIETETEFDRDARALREQVLAQATGEADAADNDGEYKGANNYIDYRKEHTIGAEKGGGWHGPLRATTHIRSSVRVDYQPDLCKDYKETGYCGYGDACKFMHDRGDYKSGWEIERDWEAKQKEQKAAKLSRHRRVGAEGEGSDEEEDGEEQDDELPFACFICRRPWDEHSEPVVTKCQHYFCEQCALKHHQRNPRCFVCEVPTNGLFNVAKDIIKKMKADKLKDK